jgi:hypothetical protein
MDLHRSYLATTCRICTEVIASFRTQTIGSVSSILQDVYKDKDGCGVSKDNADTESKNMCNRCYTMLVRWNADHQNLDPETWKPVPGSRRPRYRSRLDYSFS